MLPEFLVRLRALVFRRATDRELDEELRYHLDREADRLRAAGATHHDAEREARRSLGNLTTTTEAARDEWRWVSLERLGQDVHHSLRLLRRSPAFALTSVLCLMLGIGATTAIFSVVSAVLLRPLPYPDADHMVLIWGSSPTQPRLLMSIPDVDDLRSRNHTFEAIGVERSQSVNVTGTGGAPDRVTGNFVSASTLGIMGAHVARGRLFRPEETERGTAQTVTVISYGMWQTRYGGDSNILGRVIILNGRPHTIIGVTARDFADAFIPTTNVWLPITSAPNMGWFTRGNASVWAIGRVKPTVTIDEAKRDLRSIGAQLAAELPGTDASFTPVAIPLRQMLAGDIKPMLLTVLAFVGVVLLIACANVANLQLARAAARARELSVRAALGAGRARLVRQLLTESLVLSVIGGIAGVVAARWAVRGLVAAVPGGVPAFGAVGLNRGVLLFSLGITIGAGLLFGTVPAFYAVRANLFGALTSRNNSMASVRGFDIRQLFVGVQMALCIVLLVGAGLLARSLVSLQRIDPGFAVDHLLTAQLRLPSARYPDSARITGFMTQAIAQIRAVPGVRSAALVGSTPLSGNWGQASYVPDGAPEPAPGAAPNAITNTVTDGYFRTMGIPVLAGRDFDDHDRADRSPVIIVNDVLAERAWPGQSAIGRRLVLHQQPDITCTVVGVVGSVTHITLSDGPTAQLYQPIAQSPGIFTSIVARTSGAPDSLAPAVRAAVWKVDPDQPVWAMRSMDWWYNENVASPRFAMFLTGAFALLALVLAAVGIYGVMTFAVAQRTREVGIRMALGAQRGSVVGLVLGRAGRVIAAATVVGLIASLGAAQLIRKQLFGVGPLDPVTYLVVPVVLAAVALLASWLPARRAARVDPVIALSGD